VADTDPAEVKVSSRASGNGSVKDHYAIIAGRAGEVTWERGVTKKPGSSTGVKAVSGVRQSVDVEPKGILVPDTIDIEIFSVSSSELVLHRRLLLPVATERRYAGGEL
jgi:hypothetical protein